MRTDQAHTGNVYVPVLAVSLELAAVNWKVALHDGRREKPAVHMVPQHQAAARLQATLNLIEIHKEKWSLPEGVRIVVSYEAGQDAFWICRALQRRHIECHVVDPASIPVERHQRRAKTDRLDVIKLVINLRAWLRGERDRMQVVHMPSQEDEATRHLMRERGQLQKEILQHCDRMRKLLATIGCWDAVDHRTFAGRLERREVHCHDGAPLPRELHERLLRECERLALVKHQLAVLEKTRDTQTYQSPRASVPMRWRASRELAKWARHALPSSCSGGTSTTVGKSVHASDWYPNPSTVARVRSTRGSANRETGGYARFWSRSHGPGCATSLAAH